MTVKEWLQENNQKQLSKDRIVCELMEAYAMGEVNHIRKELTQHYEEKIANKNFIRYLQEFIELDKQEYLKLKAKCEDLEEKIAILSEQVPKGALMEHDKMMDEIKKGMMLAAKVQQALHEYNYTLSGTKTK